MKNIKKLELVIWLMLCLQESNMHAAQESKQEFEQEREELIYNTVVNYPSLTQTFNFLHEQKKIDQTFHDFLEQNLSRDENAEANFGQVMGQAEDKIEKSMKDIFLATLNESIRHKKSFDQFDNPLFQYVIQHKDYSMHDMAVQWLCKWNITKDEFGQAPLHFASYYNSVEVVKMLIDAGADFNTENNASHTPLHYASYSNSIEILRILIDAGANFNAKDDVGHTPLHYAADTYHIEIARMLIDAGADLNSKDNSSYTPLHCAIIYGHIEIASILIKAGADLNSKDRRGNTPLHYAVISNRIEIVRMLIDAGANTTIENNQNQTPLHIAQTDEMRSVVIHQNNNCCTIS